jgi:hypothetical protein
LRRDLGRVKKQDYAIEALRYERYAVRLCWQILAQRLIWIKGQAGDGP